MEALPENSAKSNTGSRIPGTNCTEKAVASDCAAKSEADLRGQRRGEPVLEPHRSVATPQLFAHARRERKKERRKNVSKPRQGSLWKGDARRQDASRPIACCVTLSDAISALERPLRCQEPPSSSSSLPSPCALCFSCSQSS
eukprot:1018138-Rhodomonas_salina.1